MSKMWKVPVHVVHGVTHNLRPIDPEIMVPSLVSLLFGTLEIVENDQEDLRFDSVGGPERCVR
jgi:hypothetical protein